MTAEQRYDPDLAGTVFDIQRFSVHDGPGIRTVVFLKGCSLRCIWCSNPESMKQCEQLGIYPDRCIGIDGHQSAHWFATIKRLPDSKRWQGGTYEKVIQMESRRVALNLRNPSIAS